MIASPDDNPAHGTVIASFPHQGSLGVGSGYSQSQTFLLPQGFQLHGHIFVQTDSGGVVFENGNESNNFAEAKNVFDITPIPYADLVVSSVNVPATGASSQPLPISWTVSNQGIGVTNTSSWDDKVSLATDPAGTNIVVVLGLFEHIGVIAPGGSYTHTVSASLPDGLQGTFYVVVKTGGPYEFIYGNNNITVSGPVIRHPDASPRPGPLADRRARRSRQAGDRVDVSWTVGNLGPGDASGSWIDSLELDEVGGSRVFKLGQFPYSLPLQAGKSYTRDELVQLPIDVQGVFQFKVTTAAGLFQNGATGNDAYADPDLLTLELPPSPDLQVASVTAPSTASAGGTVELNFKVINQGTRPDHHSPLDRQRLPLARRTRSAVRSSWDPSATSRRSCPARATRPTPASLVIPNRFAGPAYLIVQTDSGNAIDETPNEGNNTFSSPISIKPYPPADLVTSDVAAPDQAFDGTSISVTYTVSNKGLNPTDVANWTDTIWLAHDAEAAGRDQGRRRPGHALAQRRARATIPASSLLRRATP